MSWRRALMGLSLAVLTAGVARADELSLGVFLPEASFTTNAERSAWAQRLADTLSAATAGEHTFVPRTFARRADVIGFIRAKRVDVLVTDGLLLASAPADVIAHASNTPAATLYGAEGTTVEGLRGQVVALAEVGDGDVTFYVNAALAGELAPRTFFGEVRDTKDAGAALGAVRAGAARAAFAPADHPAAAGLRVLAQGGAVPLAVVAVVSSERVDASLQRRLATALATTGAAGGGLGRWVAGGGDAATRARSLAKRQPRVLTASPILASSDGGRVAPPPLRLRTTGKVDAPQRGPAVSLAPTLEDP